MLTYQVSVNDPKAARLLRDLADMNLITLQETGDEGFMKFVKRLRTRAAGNPPTLEEITKEVEAVRKKRYARGSA